MTVDVRDADPDTSRAAASVSSEAIKGQARRWLLSYLTRCAATDEQMYAAYSVVAHAGDVPRITDARLRHCRRDLELAGLIAPTGEKRKNKSGSKARVWSVA